MAREGNLIEGKYRLSELLGEGSMGSVWKATHEGLGRSFAVKFLKDYGPSTADMRERFLREARMAAAVRHRCVVDVVDVGATPEGTPYMVMECLTGDTLAQRLDQNAPLPVQDFLTVLEQALMGLEAVHRAGIVHRDLKPENIVLCREGDDVVPKLVDFGISRVIEGGADFHRSSGASATSPGATVGTPLYMAPEQVRAGGVLDGRTDVYAAGVILYEGLAGRVPFDNSNLQQLLEVIAVGGAPAITVHRPDLPDILAAVVARAMSLDPARRFASAAELAVALSGAAAHVAPGTLCGRLGQGGTAERLLSAARSKKGGAWRRFLRPPVFVASAALTLLVAGGAALSARNRTPALPPPPAHTSAWKGNTLDILVAEQARAPRPSAEAASAEAVPPAVLAPEAQAPARATASAPSPRGPARSNARARVNPRPPSPDKAERRAPETFRDPGF